MSKVGDLHKSHKQLSRPILSENTPQDRSLWHLSLVLMEIAEQQARVIKTEPQQRIDIEDTVSDQDNSLHNDSQSYKTH